MLTNLWTQREEATACFIKKVRSFRIICYFILHFIIKISQCFHLSLSRAAYTYIIRNHLTNSLHFHVVFYRLARIRRILQVGKALIFLKGQFLSVVACTSIIQNHLTNSLHSRAVFYRLACTRRTLQIRKVYLLKILISISPHYSSQI